MAECIHGFDEGMCDICFPRTAPEPVVTAAASTRTAVRAPRVAPTRPATRRAAGTAAGVPAKVPPFTTRRLYHVTPLVNLESILLDGELRSVAGGLEPDLDVAAALVRQLRAHADVGDGRYVDEFVPFSASPDAERWVELRSGAEEPHWSAAARALGAADYAVLVAVGRDLGQDLVVADADAAAPGTRFALGDAARGVAAAGRVDPDLIAAEVLVPGPVPLSAVNLIAVANEPARARVRRMFADVDGVPPKVVVHPPWFVAAE
ncbi:DarT ssDNA thymidine ADP-ribosyltransferase family protein [Amnibacterium kyonggiense]